MTNANYVFMLKTRGASLTEATIKSGDNPIRTISAVTNATIDKITQTNNVKLLCL